MSYEKRYTCYENILYIILYRYYIIYIYGTRYRYAIQDSLPLFRLCIFMEAAHLSVLNGSLANETTCFTKMCSLGASIVSVISR